jgi:1-acyl-sn-glycerol-3-phosphate acyltransferase
MDSDGRISVESQKLMRSKKFYPLFWTQFLGAFNDNFLKNALVIAVTVNSIAVFGFPSAQTVAIAGGIFILPFFLFSAISGQISDKFDKSKVLQSAKILEIGIMGFSAYALFAQNYEFLLITLFLMGLQSTFFGPAKFSILPQHLNEDEILAGNALVEAGTFLAILLGTIFGSMFILFSSGVTIVSSILILISIVGYLTSRGIPAAPSSVSSLSINWNPITTTGHMVSLARKNKTVFLAILGASWFWFVGATILSVFPPLCAEYLEADGQLITLFLAVFTIGIGVGSFLCERLSYKRLEIGLVPFGSIGISFFTFLLYWQLEMYSANGMSIGGFLASWDGGLILLSLFGLSLVSGLYIVPLNTLIQERSELAVRSRIISANNIINAFFMVIASVLLLIFFQAKVSVPKIFLILSLMNGVVGIYIYLLLPEFLFRFCSWLLARCIYRMRVAGLENIPKTGGVIVASNHVSFVDWLILAAAIQRPMCFVMDHKFFKGFLVKTIMRQAKVIPIASAKEDRGVYDQAFEMMAAELRAGSVVCIFPEGTITYSGELNEFKPGILKLLNLVPVPVVPVAISGLWGSFFSRKDRSFFDKRPRKLWAKIYIDVEKSIPVGEFTLPFLFQKISKLRRSR